MSNNTFINYYRVLHVEEKAGPVEIYEAYATLIKKYYPSKRNLAKLETEEEIKMLHEMYQLVKDAGATLNDKERRCAYDVELKIYNGNRGGDVFQNLKGSYEEFVKNLSNDPSLFKNVKMIPTVSASEHHTKQDNGLSSADVIVDRISELKKQKELEEADFASNRELKEELDKIQDKKEYMTRFNAVFRDKTHYNRENDYTTNRFDKFVGSFGDDDESVAKQIQGGGIMPFTDFYPSSAMDNGDVTSCDFFGFQGQIVDDAIDNYNNVGLHEKYTEENEAALKRAFEIPFIPMDENLEKESTADAFARIQKERTIDIAPASDTKWNDLPISRQVGFMVGNSFYGKELPYNKNNSKHNSKHMAYENLIR